MSNGLDHIVFSKADGAIRDAERKMAEVDIRHEHDELVDKIRFTDHGWLKCNGSMVTIEGTFIPPVGVNKDEVPYLIKALRKYMELYSER